MLLTPEQVDLLPSEELRPWLKALLAEFELLRQRVAHLETENERLKQQQTGSTNSRNSSQPPSRDQKANQPSDKTKKKHGPPFGHQKFSRPLVDKPDRVIQVPVTECEQCHADLSRVAAEDFARRQITELPAAKPLVIETRQHLTYLSALPDAQSRAAAARPGSGTLLWAESGSDCHLLQTDAASELRTSG